MKILRVAVCLSYIEDARFLKVKLRLYETFVLEVHNTKRVQQCMYCTKTRVDWQTITITAESIASISMVKQFKP